MKYVHNYTYLLFYRVEIKFCMCSVLYSCKTKSKDVDVGYIRISYKHLSQQTLFIDILVHVNWAWLLQMLNSSNFIRLFPPPKFCAIR